MQACLQRGCRNLPFSNARQLLDLRHDLSYFKLQPLKEECDMFHMQRRQKKKNPQFSAPILAAMECQWNMAANTYTPQCHREALSSCAGCLTARLSPPGTGPRELKGTTEKVAHKYNKAPKASEGKARGAETTALLSSPASADWKRCCSWLLLRTAAVTLIKKPTHLC